MDSRRRSGAILICLLVGALAIAVFGAGCGGGDSSSDPTAAANDEAQVEATSDATDVKITKKGFGSGTVTAVLRPVDDGSEAAGRFQYTTKLNESRLIKLRATGLDPASGNRQYAVWQKGSRRDMVLLATWHVGADGRLKESWEPNSASQRFLEDGSRTTLLITKVGDIARLSEARNSYDHIYIGNPVLEGAITGPLVGFKEGE
jgi:hypothetical protein